MNHPTKNQHYIWRSYLAAWTNNNSAKGQIMCLRENKIFPVSLMKIAQENRFYGIKELSDQERNLIYEMTIKNKTGAQQVVNEGWLNIYIAPFDLLEKIASGDNLIYKHQDQLTGEEDQKLKNWMIEYIEKLHSQIELSGIPYILLLRRNDLDFWDNEDDRDKFSFYLCNQYFRTKKVRDGIITAFETAKREKDYFTNIRPENMWIPLSLIFASNLGAYIASHSSAVLLQTEDSHFVVGDQPVINTWATFDMAKAPEDIELFYPITPNSALLLTSESSYTNGQIVKLTAEETAKYNILEKRSAKEMIFAKEESHLKAFIA